MKTILQYLAGVILFLFIAALAILGMLGVQGLLEWAIDFGMK